MKIICHVKTKQKKSGKFTLIPDKVDFQEKNITMDNRTHFIMINGHFIWEYNHKNVYASNNRASKHMKQNLVELHEETDE